MFNNSANLVVIVTIAILSHGVYAVKDTAVGQNVIDSLVDRAFFILTAAADPGSDMIPEEAIASAKNIAAKLRNIALNDQNQKYILFKTGELENQIYLEEEGILTEKKNYRQKSANDLIPPFNAELAKQRPDFKDLWSIQKQMAGLDTNMANEVENFIRKRSIALAKEIPYFIETDIEDSKLDEARADLAYCQVNGGDLGLSPSRYAVLEAKLNAKTRSNDDREQAVKGLERFKDALSANNLYNARNENRFLSDKIMALRSAIQSYEWVRLNKDYELLRSKYGRKTDSLCTIAIDLLHNKGPYAASAFLDTMRSAGLDVEKVNQIDRMILETVVAEKQRSDTMAAATGVQPESDDTGTMEDADLMLADLMATARKRSREKNDSQAMAAKDLGRTTQIEEVRKARLKVAFQLQQMREKDKQEMKNSVALRELIEIYTCMEQSKAEDALQRFTASKEMLQKNLPKEDFDKVAEMVKNSEGAAGKR